MYHFCILYYYYYYYYYYFTGVWGSHVTNMLPVAVLMIESWLSLPQI